ncbi:MAG: hypothetical protein ABFS42_04950 [Candidatus Krumholzibacteriota bacterium]
MKSIRNSLMLMMVALFLVPLQGCSDDESPTAPPKPLPMVEVTWQANFLRVYQDCDSSAARAEGDFHISFKLSDVTGEDELLLAEKTNVIIKANSGTTVQSDQMNIFLKSELPLKDGTRLLLRMSIYELDPDGPQVSIGNGFHYTYSSVTERWESEDDEGGMTFGSPDYHSLTLEGRDPATCYVVMSGKFYQDLILE